MLLQVRPPSRPPGPHGFREEVCGRDEEAVTGALPRFRCFDVLARHGGCHDGVGQNGTGDGM